MTRTAREIYEADLAATPRFPGKLRPQYDQLEAGERWQWEAVADALAVVASLEEAIEAVVQSEISLALAVEEETSSMTSAMSVYRAAVTEARRVLASMLKQEETRQF